MKEPPTAGVYDKKVERARGRPAVTKFFYSESLRFYKGALWNYHLTESKLSILPVYRLDQHVARCWRGLAPM
jgi:hypothetical protein